MDLTRHKILRLGAGVVLLSAVSRAVSALDYPTRPVRILVGFAAGSAFDILARLIAQWLSERLGQPFVVENRSGAAGSVATEAVARARPDGYALLITGSPDAINATLYDNLSFKFVQDIAPVAGIGRAPNVMVVHPSLPAKTVPEFIAYAKANPGKISMASAGVGSSSHMSGELFKMMSGVSMVHVPYRGQAPALTDLLSGQVQVDFSTMPPAIEYVKAGKLQALAVTSPERFEGLPDIPTMAEYLPGYEASLLTGLGAPSNTPAEIVELINTETNRALADPKIKAQLAALGNTVLPGSPADFGRLIAKETDKWAKVIKFANIKPE
ncbi:MAG TPA: tripartite tricarboxylate transporter substrate binding protein [Telluria sp.]